MEVVVKVVLWGFSLSLPVWEFYCFSCCSWKVVLISILLSSLVLVHLEKLVQEVFVELTAV